VSDATSAASPQTGRTDGTGWVDSHCHVTASEFDEDRAAVLERAREAGVALLVAIGSGYGIEDAERAASLAGGAALAGGPQVVATAGVHPHDARLWDARAAEVVARCLDAPRVVAVGECGLDYWYEHSPREAQRRALADQLGLARERGLPVSIHVRDRGEDAYRELMELWRSEGGGRLRGVLHCYTHSEAYARAAMDEGLYVSFSGILTFKNDRGLRAVAAALPLERLLVETDAPLLAPQGFRGKRNEPARVVQVGEALAAAQGRPLDEVARVTGANARALFALSDPAEPT
jgi:TatD DNase family protein